MAIIVAPAACTEPTFHEPRAGWCRRGAFRFEAGGRRNWVAYCYYESCRATGAPVAAYARFPEVAVTFGDTPPTAYASAPGVRRGFYGRCGSPVSFVGDCWPGEIHLHLGCVDDTSDLVADREAYAAERLP
ncbi:MAG: GFA family protein [Geminicoccaceae bacterium]